MKVEFYALTEENLGDFMSRFDVSNFNIGDDVVVIDDDEILSEDEFYDNYQMCEECGNYFAIDDLAHAYKHGDDVWVCEHCRWYEYDTCNDCGERHHADDIRYISGDAYCQSCFDSYDCNGDICYCNGCNEFYFYDDGRCDNHDNFYCNDCINDGCGHFYSDCVNSYHGSGSIKSEFLDDTKRTLEPHMGYELEVDNNDYDCGDAPDNVNSILNDNETYVVMETDGSLSSGGFEIISRPATLKTHLEHTDKLQETFRYLISEDYRSHNAGTCGLHIHLDRRYFGDTHTSQELGIAKLLIIFAKHWYNLVRFSRRNCDQCDQWCARNSSAYDYETAGKAAKHGQSNRYLAVNLRNPGTVEIRLWRGTLRWKTFLATLKFTNRLAVLAKTTRIAELIKLEWKDILGDDEDILEYWETVKDRSI